MSTTRLKIYNGALERCGDRSLASLTENREPRRLLDEVWNDGGVRFCLEQGQWSFASRLASFDYDTTVTPSFGYNRAFEKPTDLVIATGVCADEHFKIPLLEYEDEAGYWYADQDILYVKYISDDGTYGGDLTKWPGSFTEYVKSYFAWRIVMRLTSDQVRQKAVFSMMEEALSLAKNKDAMGGPTRFPPAGSWLQARRGGWMTDGGNDTSGNLIG